MRVGGGASTIQQYLRAGLVDEMHFAIVPVLLGRGERLFDNLDDALAGTSAWSSSDHRPRCMFVSCPSPEVPALGLPRESRVDLRYPMD